MAEVVSSDADLRDRLRRLSPEAQAALRARLASGSGPAPVSYQQRNFWLLHQLAADPAAYNAPLRIRLTGPLDVDALRAAFAAVVRGHRIYRTVYHQAEGGGVRASVREGLEAEFVVEETDRGEADAIARLRAAERRPFMLDAEAPVRVRLVRVGPEAHVLGLVFHHVAADGGALNLFWAALRRAYDAAVTGAEPPAVAEAAQYDGFAARQAARREGPAQEAALRYWRGRLRDAPPSVAVPDDGPALVPDPEPDCEVAVSLGALHRAAEALARAERTTPHVVYLAAYVAWLHRVAGARDVVVGVPIDERSRRADRDVVGCCINQLSVRQRVGPGTPFAELLRETRTAMLDGIRHADVPFLRLVEEMASEGRGAFGFYETAFQYRNFVGPFGPLGGCAAEEVPRRRLVPQFPLMMEVFPDRAAPEVSLVYDPARFRRATAERFLGQYRTLLADALADPARPVGALAMMGAEERRLVAEVWPVGPPAPPPATVPALFAAQARERPDAVALVAADGPTTYGALDAASGRVAAALRARGVGPGDRVGVCLDRSAALVVAMLGVLRTGAAYVPLDAESPEPRLRWTAEDADVRAVVTDAAGLDRARGWTAAALTVGQLEAEGAAAPPPPVPADPEAPAYLMYTSGSTGRPKGVVVPHRGIARLVRAPEVAAVTPDDVFLQLASPSFDAATFEVWGPLLNGARLVLPPPGPPTLGDLAAAIADHGVTVLWLTAGLFHAVVDAAPASLRPLRRLLTGGDVVSPAHVRACLDACPGLELVDGYGPTENTTFSCCHRIPADHPAEAAVPIGRPLTGSEAYVLDATLAPVPVGVEGELVLAGDGLALGYWRRPELTAERFVPHPFRPGALAYRTGDRARFRPDGTVTFHGRRDHQVKVRGYRVELGEVEAALLGVPGVAQAAAVARGEALVAYVAPAAAAEPARTALAAALPPYLVPSVFVGMEALPLTAGGKVDRQALPPPSAPAVGAEGGPRTDLEAGLLAIWRRLFDSDAVGCTDDVFARGATSLMAVRFLAEAERRLGRRIPLTTLFQHPTVRGLAGALSGGGSEWVTLVPLGTGPGEPLFAVHGVGGRVDEFRLLARLLDGAHAVVGVQAAEHAGGEAPSSFEAAAARYAREIRAYRPEGPLAVVGFSMGGMLAYEVVRQLRAAGAEARLFVVDTVPVNLPRRVRLRALAGFLRKRAAHHARVVLARPRGLASYARARLQGLRDHFPEPATGPPAAAASDVSFYAELQRRYVPRPAGVPVVLFEAVGRGVVVDARVAWRYLAGPSLTVVPVEGDHFVLRREAGRAAVAEVFRARLGPS